MNRQGSFQRNEQFYGLWFDTFCSVFKYSLFELSEYLKNSTAFSMKLKNLKGNYRNFYNITQSHQYRLKLREMWDEMTELNYRKLCWENWKVFKEIFEAAVHSSDSISNIEKFTYLKTYLDKSALQATARASPDKWKLHRGMATDRWKVRKWTVNYILSYEQSDKIRSNYPTNCKRNTKIARYHRKQCARVIKLRNKLWTFRTFVSAYYIEKIT